MIMSYEKHITDNTSQITGVDTISSEHIEKILSKLHWALRTNNLQTQFSFTIKSSKNMAVRMSIYYGPRD